MTSLNSETRLSSIVEDLSAMYSTQAYQMLVDGNAYHTITISLQFSLKKSKLDCYKQDNKVH